MKSDEVPFRPLREIELGVEAEMREWGRKRLQQKLQEQADPHGRVFPPERSGAVACSAATPAAAHRRGRG
jgi:hypothetical protein